MNRICNWYDLSCKGYGSNDVLAFAKLLNCNSDWFSVAEVWQRTFVFLVANNLNALEDVCSIIFLDARSDCRDLYTFHYKIYGVKFLTRVSLILFPSHDGLKTILQFFPCP